MKMKKDRVSGPFFLPFDNTTAALIQYHDGFEDVNKIVTPNDNYYIELGQMRLAVPSGQYDNSLAFQRQVTSFLKSSPIGTAEACST